MRPHSVVELEQGFHLFREPPGLSDLQSIEMLVFERLVEPLHRSVGHYAPQLAANPEGFPELVKKLIQLEKEPMAWEEDVRALKTPVLVIVGDADAATLEHFVAMFRFLGGGVMGDLGNPLPSSRLAILPATSHTAVITQTDLLLGFIEPFLKGENPKGFFEQ